MFYTTVDGWMDYSKPISLRNTFHKWIDKTQQMFPLIWCNFFNLHEVNIGEENKK